MVFRSRTLRSCLFLAGFLSLYMASIPLTVNELARRLEVYPPIDLSHSAAEAIVVLGADRYANAPEYGGDTVHRLGLERLRYAALLQKKTGLPILVSGGAVLGEKQAEAALMRDVLKTEFAAEVRWEEGESRNTYENAQRASKILKGIGIGEIILVTHAWHMPRALEAFEHNGMRVDPAPTGFMRPSASETEDFKWLPNAASLHNVQWLLHELLGRGWYYLHYYRTANANPS